MVLEVDVEGLSAVEQALFDAGALSLTLRDQFDEPVLEPAPGEIRLWNSLIVTALFPIDDQPDRILEAATESYGRVLPECRFEQLPDGNWERSWMARFKAMQFGRQLWVCPSHVEPPDPAAINLRLDPGLAFGTGTHATTALCLEWLALAADAGNASCAGNALRDKTLVDYGCGSGILAVAAGLLGAKSVIGLDIDPQAMLATRENAVRNGVADVIETTETVNYAPATIDIMVANILYAPLLDLAEEFAVALKPGATLVLSGLLEEQVDAVMLHYTQWFSFQQTRLLDGWAMLAARRHPG